MADFRSYPKFIPRPTSAKRPTRKTQRGPSGGLVVMNKDARSRQWVKKLPRVIEALNNEETRLIGLKPKAIKIRSRWVLRNVYGLVLRSGTYTHLFYHACAIMWSIIVRLVLCQPVRFRKFIRRNVRRPESSSDDYSDHVEVVEEDVNVIWGAEPYRFEPLARPRPYSNAFCTYLHCI